MRNAAGATVASVLAVLAAATGSAAAPRTPQVARTTTIPRCTVFVDASAPGTGNGTAASPHKTIAAAVAAAAPAAVICVAEGTYREAVAPGTKAFTLAGGFQRGSNFQVRDSAKHVSQAKGSGGSFLRITDPGPSGTQLTAIDGFEITGYERAVVREYYEPQRFDITNNFIHDNTCKDQTLAGAGFALNNVSGTIKGNVITRNACGRGGAGFLNDETNKNTVSIENNLIDGNAGTEPGASHGGGLYLFGNKLKITGNTIVNNSVTQWGGGLYIGAYNEGGQYTRAELARNVYRGNRAGSAGGGFFCDDGATCISEYEVYEKNCGANIYLDSGGSGPTVAKFDHITNADALDVDCKAPGAGVRIDANNNRVDAYTFTNSIFRGNAKGRDFVTGCSEGCKSIKVKVTVSHSTVQREYVDGGIKIAFGEGIVPPSATAAAPKDETAPPATEAAEAAPARDLPAGRARDGNADAAGAQEGASKKGAATDGTPKPAREPGDRAGDKQVPAVSPPARAAESGVETSGDASEKDTAAKDDGSKGSSESGTPAPADEISPKEAFQAAKDIGTLEAWNLFLTRFPKGFRADLARLYVKKLQGEGAATAAAPTKAAPRPADASAPAATPSKPRVGSAQPEAPSKAVVQRGGKYMGFAERFNRYYTDPAWKPSWTVYVSPDGNGDGATRESPAAAKAAVAEARPGARIVFLRGTYTGGFEFTKETSGTYDEPIVVYGERNSDKSIGVKVTCTGSRQTCFNLEYANFVAVDGFELVGGRFGVRAVGEDYDASRHARGIAVLDCKGHDQSNDPFFSGQVDWAVWEGNVAYGAKAGDGHGIYLSNGGDWNIVRKNETYGNVSSDFQVNPSPENTCKEAGIAYADPRCDAYAGEGEGGRGASDYFLIDSNYFHHGKGPGANFTSLRRSIIRNNIFGPQARHNVSFWQETDNPKLGTSDNKVVHNLFVTTERHAVQFAQNSTRNAFVNNLILGLRVGGGGVTANPAAKLMEVDDTVGENVYRSNFYVGGKLVGRSANEEETSRADFSAEWFTKFPVAINHDPNDFRPTSAAPFLQKGTLMADAPSDRNGAPRLGQVDLGPIEVP